MNRHMQSKKAAGVALIILSVAPGFSAITNVRVQGVTSTQAILAYTAPDNNRCAVEVSESPTYVPLVHDVDGALFTGENFDSRLAATNGRYRMVVVGRRGMNATWASNPFLSAGKLYSRALQANSQHYFRITCGADVATGTFTTLNIPLGGTYPEPLAAASGGYYNWPSIVSPASRAETIVDPNTGSLIRKITMSSESTAGDQNSWPSGGFYQLCSHLISSAGGHTYDMCLVPAAAYSTLYSIETDTGNAYSLTRLSFQYGSYGCLGTDTIGVGQVFWSLTNPLELYLMADCNIGHGEEIYKAVWTGALNSSNAVPGNVGTPDSHLTITRLTQAGIAALLNSFDSTFNSTQQASMSFYGRGTNEGKLIFGVDSQQDALGWVVVFDPGNDLPLGSGGTGGIIAANPFWKAPAGRWCTLHAIQNQGDNNPWIAISSNSLTSGSAGYMSTPYSVTVANNAGTGTSIAISPTNGSYEPQSLGTPTYLQDAEVGDLFWVNVEDRGYLHEPVELVAKDPATHTWTVLRGNDYSTSKFIFGSDVTPGTRDVTNITAGMKLYAGCRAFSFSAAVIGYAATWYWNFVNDPHGTSIVYPAVNGTTSNQAVENYATGGHSVTRDSVNTQAGGTKAGITTGSAWEWWNYSNSTPGFDLITFSNVVNANPMFASAQPPGGGNTYQQHQSYDQMAAPAQERQWFVDAMPFINVGSYTGTGALVSGQTNTYKVTGTTTLHRKQITTLASCGAHPLIDISSTAKGNVISDSTTYSYCVANAANECRTGSSIGDVYLNCPGATELTCDYNSANGAVDMCIGDSWSYGNGAVQVSPFTTDVNGASARLISHLFATHHEEGIYGNVRPTSDGKWMMFFTGNPTGTPEAYMAKLGPFPAEESTRRDTFVPIRLSVGGKAEADNVVVEFGYAENGDPGNFYCTSRQEACVAQSATVDEAHPFYYSVTEAPSIRGTPCSSGCTVAIPAIHGRVVYYQVSYRDSSGNVSSRLPVTAEATP